MRVPSSRRELPATSTSARAVLPGWAIELVLLAALLPFLVSAVDLFARCRRRHIPLTPALRSYRSRVGFWLWAAILFELFALIGIWPSAPSVPLPLDAAPATDWPVIGVLALAFLVGLGWLVARARLTPRGPVSATEQLAGAAAALRPRGRLTPCGGDQSLRVDLPPAVVARLALAAPRAAAADLDAAGRARRGLPRPLLLLGSFAFRYGLGLDTPWYLAELTATGYVKLAAVAIAVAWLGAAGQMTALTVGRYAPYPSARERPPRGPLREAVCRTVLTVRAARRKPAGTEREAVEGEHEGILRVTGTVMLAAGVAVLVWVLVVWRWQDPFTALYTTWKQHQLSQSYDRRARAFRLPEPSSKTASARVVTAGQIRAVAHRYRLESKRGQAVGRLRVPRLGLNMVVVDGTDEALAEEGPRPRPADVHARRGPARLHRRPPHDLPCAVRAHRADEGAATLSRSRSRTARSATGSSRTGSSTPTTLAVLHSHGREIVELQACHPRFFASQRYIVYARLMQIEPRGAPSIRAPSRTLAAAPLASAQG